MVKYHNISLSFLTALVSERHLSDPVLKELHIWNYPMWLMYLSLMGMLKLFLAILVFRCLKSVTILLSWVTFLLINITGLE